MNDKENLSPEEIFELVDRTERLDEEEAAASPNYESDMAEDAKGIAQGLREMLAANFPNHAIVDKENGSFEVHSPLPTLDTIRASMGGVEATFNDIVGHYRENRGQSHEEKAARGCAEFLNGGSTKTLREVAQQFAAPDAVSGLSERELRDFMAVKLQDSSFAGLGIGMYVGALLTRNGLMLSEVMDCAGDGVFLIHALALRVTPATAHTYAMDTFKFVAEEEYKRAKKQLD